MALVYVCIHTQKTCNLSELKTASGVDAAACLMLFFSFGSSTSDAMNSSTKPYKTCETLVHYIPVYTSPQDLSLSLSFSLSDGLLPPGTCSAHLTESDGMTSYFVFTLCLLLLLLGSESKRISSRI